MKRAWLVALLTLGSASFAGTKFVGGGLEIGPTAPVFLPWSNPSQKVHVSQILYTQVELGFAANTRIIDVAWRKEGLGPMTGAGGCAEQVWMKNVTRQMGPFTVGSTQTLGDALQNAQKVIDKPASMLPSTMGFVTLDVVENQFSFTYLGDALEVTIISDCTAAASPIVDAPIRWRYDVVPERVRTVSGSTTDALVLVADPLLSSFRPHTRFRTLVEQPRIEIRVAGNLLPNGGTFGVAMNHFAAGLPAPFAFELINESKDSVTLMSVGVNNVTNGTGMPDNVTTPTVVGPGQKFPTPVIFIPGVAGTLSRLTVTWVTSAGTQSNTFQGTPTATPLPQPSASLLKSDGTLQSLTMPATTVVQLGKVPPGHQDEQTLVAQNFGQGSVAAKVEVVSGDVEVVTPMTMVGTQQDVPFLTRARSPLLKGPFSSEVRITVGPSIYVVRREGTVVDCEIAVAVNSVDFPSGSKLSAARVPTTVMTRTYTVSNVGDAPLFLESFVMWDEKDAQTVFALPAGLAPGQAASVDVNYPVYDPALEPYVHLVGSNDADEGRFGWELRSLISGRPVLVIESTTSDDQNHRVSRGEHLSGRTDFVHLTLRNGGDVDLNITGLTETCNRCKDPMAFTTPVKLAPTESVDLSRSTNDSQPPLNLTFNFESDDPDGPFAFDASFQNGICSVSPAPMLFGLLALWFSRRRTRRN